jgi:hypothetical protein
MTRLSPPPPPPATGPAEQTLYRCGPFGFSIRFGEPGVFKVAYRNLYEVVLTDRRLYAASKPGWLVWPFVRRPSKTAFEIRPPELERIEVTNLLAARVLVVRYQRGDAPGVVAIEAAFGRHHHAERLAELLAAWRQA